MNLAKCLDEGEGVHENNVYDRFNACWDIFKDERQRIFKEFKSDFDS